MAHVTFHRDRSGDAKVQVVAKKIPAGGSVNTFYTFDLRRGGDEVKVFFESLDELRALKADVQTAINHLLSAELAEREAEAEELTAELA